MKAEKSSHRSAKGSLRENEQIRTLAIWPLAGKTKSKATIPTPIWDDFYPATRKARVAGAFLGWAIVSVFES